MSGREGFSISLHGWSALGATVRCTVPFIGMTNVLQIRTSGRLRHLLSVNSYV